VEKHLRLGESLALYVTGEAAFKCSLSK